MPTKKDRQRISAEDRARTAANPVSPPEKIELSEAESVCLDIFKDYEEHEVLRETRSVQRAWEIGRGVYRALNDRS